MSEEAVVTDARGRKIKLRDMGPEDMLDLMEACGTSSSNTGYVQYASTLAIVAEIDGVPVPRFTKREHIRALGAKLGNDGWLAVMMHLNPPETEDDEAQRKNVPQIETPTETVSEA